VIIPLSRRLFRPFLGRAEKPIRFTVSLIATIVVAAFCNLPVARAEQSTQPDAPRALPASKLQLRDLQDQAARFNSVVTLPDWETTPAQVDANTDAAIADANRQLEIIARLDPKSVTFENTVRDEIYAVGDSRDITVSVEKFLGREHSTGPFLKKLGISAN
jgi:hypothetical protein